MNYYRRYCGDYAAATPHLTLLEHGAYVLMLDAYYTSERPLPASYDLLYRICRAQTPPEKKAVRQVAEEFFPVSQDGEFRHNPRADKELAIAIPKMAKLREVARENGKKGGSHKKPKPDPDSAPERAPDPAPKRQPSENPSLKQPPSTNHQPTAKPLSDNRFPGDEGITAPPGKAAAASTPTATPEATARVIAECTRAGIPAPAEDAVVQRWIRKGHTPTQVMRACAEACTSFKAPKPMTSGYVDGILERIVADDRKAKAQADAKVAASDKLRQDQRDRAKDAAPPPDGLMDKFAKKRAA